jgi:hypothetical protein
MCVCVCVCAVCVCVCGMCVCVVCVCVCVCVRVCVCVQVGIEKQARQMDTFLKLVESLTCVPATTRLSMLRNVKDVTFACLLNVMSNANINPSNGMENK